MPKKKPFLRGFFSRLTPGSTPHPVDRPGGAGSSEEDSEPAGGGECEEREAGVERAESAGPDGREALQPQEEGEGDAGRPDAALGESDEDMLDGFSASLGELGPDAIPVIRTALRNKDWEIRVEAVGLLRRIGAEAIPALVEALEDENKYVRLAAIG
ncbi:MAG: HEAT repeat domain-containing protein, partial [Planctomycetes bacterium]|nr:HEAT repeat domain-containing protein [Planctomycetota bacterium]